MPKRVVKFQGILALLVLLSASVVLRENRFVVNNNNNETEDAAELRKEDQQKQRQTPSDVLISPIVQRSLHLRRPLQQQQNNQQQRQQQNLTAAICHKSLFGNISIPMILEWVAYHRLLGFDHIFLSYLPSTIPAAAAGAGLDTLQSLPYVTLFENPNGTIVTPEHHFETGYQRLGGTVRQRELEARCLDHDAKGYDWVLLSDADEYLWFDNRQQYNIEGGGGGAGGGDGGIKDFLAFYQQQGYDYISLGKSMYTMKHRVAAKKDSSHDEETGFVLRHYPFTAGPYCTMPKKRGKVCARKNGRAKVLVKPSVHHGHVNIHGTHVPSSRKESIHLYATQAHFKEWNAATVVPPRRPGTLQIRQRQNFTAYTAEAIHVNGYNLYPKNEQGGVTMEYDDQLEDWFRYVESRGSLTEVTE